MQRLTHVKHLLAAVPCRGVRTGRHRLNIKEDLPSHPPPAVVLAEAKRMGQLDMDAHQPTARSVPEKPSDFAAARAEYNRQLSILRKQYRADWQARQEREQTAMYASWAEEQEMKASRQAIRDERKAERAALQSALVASSRAAKRLGRESTARAQALWLQDVDARRQQWLDELEADAENWVAEDRIDELITEDTFAMKYPWQYREYFEAKAARLAGSLPSSEDPFNPDEVTEQASVDYTVDQLTPYEAAASQGLQARELTHKTARARADSAADHTAAAAVPPAGYLPDVSDMPTEQLRFMAAEYMNAVQSADGAEEANIRYLLKTGQFVKALVEIARLKTALQASGSTAVNTVLAAEREGVARPRLLLLEKVEEVGLDRFMEYMQAAEQSGATGRVPGMARKTARVEVPAADDSALGLDALWSGLESEGATGAAAAWSTPVGAAPADEVAAEADAATSEGWTSEEPSKK